MTAFQIEARDPLVIRDGRPNDGRSESQSLSFPLPSTLAGVVRTALGRRNGAFDSALVPSLLEHVVIRGPLLVKGVSFLVPAPSDAVLMKNDDGTLRIDAIGILPPSATTATSDIGAPLSLVGLAAGIASKSKPHTHAPRFWPWAAFEEWLRDPANRNDQASRNLLIGALVALEHEERVHVAMGPDGTAVDGMLFGTDGLRLAGKTFRTCDADHVDTITVELFVDVDVREKKLGQVTSGLRPMGGERRLTQWHDSRVPLPGVPDWLKQHVEQGESALVRVLLLTPAYVEHSQAPAQLARAGVAEIVAAKVDRPRVISGWDLAKGPPGGQPKKTRRLAESGSVYWVRLTGNYAERRKWLDDVWMKNISDDPQLARDGFGLAAIGIGREP